MNDRRRAITVDTRPHRGAISSTTTASSAGTRSRTNTAKLPDEYRSKWMTDFATDLFWTAMIAVVLFVAAPAVADWIARTWF